MQFNRAELAQMMRGGLHSFALELGRIVAAGMLEDEVTQLCGALMAVIPNGNRSVTVTTRAGLPWAARSALIERPRVRSVKGRGEVRLRNYSSLQQSNQMAENVLRRMVRGVSCRDYAQVIDTAQKAFGVKRSSVSGPSNTHRRSESGSSASDAGTTFGLSLSTLTAKPMPASR